MKQNAWGGRKFFDSVFINLDILVYITRMKHFRFLCTSRLTYNAKERVVLTRNRDYLTKVLNADLLIHTGDDRKKCASFWRSL